MKFYLYCLCSFLLANTMFAAYANAACDVPPANQICFDQNKELLRPFFATRQLAPLYVKVRYGTKKISQWLGDRDYARDEVPEYFQRDIVDALNNKDVFTSVLELGDGAPVPNVGFMAEITLNPEIKLTKTSEAIGVGSAGLYALVGGKLTTEFKLKVDTRLYKLMYRGRTMIAKDSYFISGMATSTLYKERENIAKAWGASFDLTLPHVLNVVLDESIRSAESQWAEERRHQMELQAKIQAAEAQMARERRRSESRSKPTRQENVVENRAEVSTEKRPPRHAVNRAIVRDAQRLLTALGYNPGPVDGLMGRKTREAIKRFQQDNGFQVNGEPSKALVGHLENSVAQTNAPDAAKADASRTTDDLGDLDDLSDF